MFAYLGVLISIIMGLAITHLLVGISKVVQKRSTVRVSWAQVLWTASLLVYVLAIWWGMFWWNDLAAWRVHEFLFITLYAIALFMLAAMLYPWDMADDFDGPAYFDSNRVWFFSMYAAAWIIDVPETLLKAGSDLRGVPQSYAVFVGLKLLIAATGMKARSRRIQRVLPVADLVFNVSYLSFTTLSVIAR